MSRQSAVREENGFTWFILNEDRNDIIKVLKSLEDSGILIDRVTEIVKYEITKKQEGRCLESLLAPLSFSLVQPVFYSVVKGITRRGVRRAERR